MFVGSQLKRQYSPGSKNAIKARDNWLAKSRYMHTEIHKYETYLDALRSAIALRVKKQGENKLDRSLRRSVGSLHMLNDEGNGVEIGNGGGEDGRATPIARR